MDMKVVVFPCFSAQDFLLVHSDVYVRVYARMYIAASAALFPPYLRTWNHKQNVYYYNVLLRVQREEKKMVTR